MKQLDTITQNNCDISCVNKAGSILINPITKKIGLIYRHKQQDFSFPKGHQEENETPLECAKRETVEETQRDIEILAYLQIQKYISKKGKNITVHWFLAKDIGPTTQIIEEDLRHKLIWVDFDKVDETLTYDNLKQLFKSHAQVIKNFLNS